MYLNVKEKKLRNESVIYKVSKSNNEIILTADIPTDAAVFIKSNIGTELIIPLYLKQISSEGNIFTGNILFNYEHINYIKKHPLDVYNLFIVVNKEVLEGSVKFTIPSVRLATYNKPELDLFLKLSNDLNKLSADLYKTKKEYPKFMPSKIDLNKGMIPVATGVGNEYKWDYPFDSITKYLKNTIEIVNSLSCKYDALLDRVNDLNKQIIDHIYEGYNVV